MLEDVYHCFRMDIAMEGGVWVSFDFLDKGDRQKMGEAIKENLAKNLLLRVKHGTKGSEIIQEETITHHIRINKIILFLYLDSVITEEIQNIEWKILGGKNARQSRFEG